MVNINHVYPNELIEKAAEELKNIEAIQPPVWTAFVKTGAHKERAPMNKQWWYKRVAAILRSVYILGPIGVSKLRTKYGGKRDMGHRPSQFRKGSGSIIRKSLQQLEKAGLIKFTEIGVHKGRVVTPKGKSFLDKITVQILKQQRKNKPKEEKPIDIKKEEKKPAKVPKEQPKQEKPVEKSKNSQKQGAKEIKKEKKEDIVGEPQK